MKVPRPLAVALNRWHDEAATRNFVRALERHGVPVAVHRLQLGNPKAQGFGTLREIYRTPAPKEDLPCDD